MEVSDDPVEMVVEKNFKLLDGLVLLFQDTPSSFLSHWIPSRPEPLQVRNIKPENYAQYLLKNDTLGQLADPYLLVLLKPILQLDTLIRPLDLGF
jgi:hypothetical protein